jgi:uncharacterized membrane protein YadS
VTAGQDRQSQAAVPAGGGDLDAGARESVARVTPPAFGHTRGQIAVSLVIVVGLAALTRFLDLNVPAWAKGTSFEGIAKSIEYPVYAIVIGFGSGALISALGIRDRVNAAFRTEFFIKTGLVLLGASINLSVIFGAAGPSIAQSLVMVTVMFLATWFIGAAFGLDMKLRALLAAAVSICGVSAAIAAAGAVHARKEQLAYATGLVILFAVPAIFIQPWLAGVLGLSQAVAGAWIGGNIDTTAAVTAAGTLVGEDALKIATIVKVTQNALMGVVAFLLAAYFVFRVERTTDARVPLAVDLWHRFPKFVLGFVAASIIATWWLGTVDATTGKNAIGVANTFRTWFLILAFVSIGLEFRARQVREAGWRPIGVFAIATVLNLVLALLVASVLFGSFTVS